MRINRSQRSDFFDRARGLTETLAWLRLCAVAGQSVTVAIVALVLRVPIPVTPLAAGIIVLAAFGAFAFWRLRRSLPVHPLEAVGHMAVDIGVLSWLLYFSGGATNPFVSLLVLPIALAAAALPLRHVITVALLAATCYLALVPWHVALPPLHASEAGAFYLHITGQVASFVVTAGVLAFFIARLASALREREAEVQLERERTLRDEGILAIATQAAGTAHELNTPLATIRTLLVELKREHADDCALSEDLALLAGQAERCRDILRELVAIGTRQLSGTSQTLELGRFVDECENQFRLLRPEIELDVTVAADAATHPIAVKPSLRHALINLLSNAADASASAGRSEVELRVEVDAEQVEFSIRDQGSGNAPGHGLRFQTSKRDGLGLGLALAHATAERLGGTLRAEATVGGGWCQRLRVPLATTDNRSS